MDDINIWADKLGIRKTKNFPPILEALLFAVVLALALLYITNTMTVTHYEAEEPVTMEADITMYGWTGNRMASGDYPFVGAVATSDRSIPLGTEVMIKGVRYVVKDRTALWVYEDFENVTFDIYSEDTEEEMLEFGRQVVIVTML